MGYGHFKSEGRAARRGHIAEFRGIMGTVLLRPVKSDKGGMISNNGEVSLNRHWGGANWLATANVLTRFAVPSSQKLTRL